VTELRHHKTGRLIGNVSVCTDEFGTLWFRCQYTKKLVACDVAIMLGAVMPQVTCTFVCAPDALEAFRASKREFDALDANCNSCENFVRVKHDKSPYGFLRGTCGIGVLPDHMVYDIEDNVFWIHPDDHMGMPCWKARQKSEARLQDRAADQSKRAPDGDLPARKQTETTKRSEVGRREADREPAQAVRGSGTDQRVEPAKVNDRWVAIDGSIFTEREFEQKTAVGKFIKVRRSIAFNVGKETAQHIVDLHNGQVEDTAHDLCVAIGAMVIDQATACGWKQDDPEGAFEFLMRRCREVAIDDAAPAAWNKFIRYLNEHHPLLAKYKMDKQTRERVMVSSEPWAAFCGSIEWYRNEFLKANGS
jgi:hypothetical protein